MVFIDAMEELAMFLARSGYTVELPQREEGNIDWDGTDLDRMAAVKRRLIDDHLEKIKQSDVVLLANYEKNGVPGYVGPNTLMEAAFGYALNIPVALLFDAQNQPCSVELAAIARLTLGGEIEKLQELWTDP